jgi:hypothetical protein
MAYQFDVSYPANAVPNGQDLHQKQADILRRFPRCHYTSTHNHPIGELGSSMYHSSIYITDRPQEIANVATSLREADPRIFVGFISHDGQSIYYHPAELARLPSHLKQQYIRVMEQLPQTQRILHDYLVNLYHSVPTHKEFPLLN